MAKSKVIAEWIEALGSDDFNTAQTAKAHLLSLGSIVVDDLIDVMQNGQGRRTWAAAEVLSKIDDPRCRKVMEAALTAANPLIGQIAVITLDRYGEDVLDILLAALPTSHHMVQLQIVGSLEKIGSRRAVATLMTLLRETDSSALRHTIIQALGIIGDPQAADLIRSFQDDEDYHVRKRVAAALERLSAASSDHA